MKEYPLISIILPVYNGEAFLNEVIQCILNQTYKNFELIIVNDCSTDRSLVIANTYACLDRRIKIINNNENKKLPTSLNIGHEEAIGDLLTWTSDDNLIKVNFLESLYYAIIREKCDLVFSNYDIILSDGSIKREHVTGPVQKLLFGNVIGASFLYKKKIFSEMGGYNPNLFLVEDYDFFLRASLKFEFYHLNENLYQYRIHEKSLTRRIGSDKNYSDLHSKSLKQLYRGLNSAILLHKPTIKLILDLYFNSSIELKTYIKNSKIIKKDIKLFQRTIKYKQGKSSLYFLEEAIKNNWIKNSCELNVGNLIRVSFSQNSILFGENSNRNMTLRIIYLCFKW